MADSTSGSSTSPKSSDTSSSTRSPSFFGRHWGKLTFTTLILVPALIFTIWAGATMTFTYSSGERSGFLQKLSQKGWVCKTWEGELAMVNMPGAMSQMFNFSVRNDSIAGVINEAMVQNHRVVLTYKQHVGVPTSCFGETQYFVSGVKVIQ
jgi:hypothetical protein